jgi:hypothetical protein
VPLIEKPARTSSETGNRLLLDEMDIEEHSVLIRKCRRRARAERAVHVLLVGITVVFVPIVWLALVTYRHTEPATMPNSPAEQQRNTGCPFSGWTRRLPLR